MTKIKFCGLTRPCDIEAANEIRPDYIGFVFVSNSRRCVSDTQAAKLKELLRKDIIAVGVFLNDEIEHVISLLKSGVIDAAQLHGDESNEDIVRIQQETNKPVIKAFRIRSKEDIAAAEMTNADYMMFDAGAGEGKTFDWEMIKTIRTLGSYAGTVLPVVYTAAAVSGAVVSSGARYAAVLLCLNILMDLLLRLAVPLIYAFLALCLSRSMYPNPVLNTAVSVVKWCTITGMTVLTTVISVYIGFTGSLTAGADAIAVKGGKMVISNALPVVGGILSDAASVVLASASVIKNSAGIYALVGICALCLSPFLAIGVKMLLFRLCATVASAIEGKRLAILLGDLSTALGMMLGVLGCMTIMLFISLMAAIKTVSP